MRAALCSKSHNVIEGGRPHCAPGAGLDWLEPLPSDWVGQVVAPLGFDRFRDFEMAAEHVRGIDEDGVVRYVAYRWVEHDLRSDDDEEYYQAAIRGTSLIAWRLRDGRWLSYRLSAGEGETARSFFSFGDAQPTVTHTD